MLKCPHCGSTHLWKNGHRKNGTQQYRCKSCLKTFYLSPTKKDKLFSFQYPTCPNCGKSLQIYKIRRGYVRFRCRECGFKMNVNRYLPPVNTNVPSNFFKFKVHPSLNPYAVKELFGENIHKRVYLGHNNAVESRYLLFKDFVRAKRGFKKFSNIFLYINGFVFTFHHLWLTVSV